MDKAGNILSLDLFKIGVDKNTRAISSETIQSAIEEAKSNGKSYFIVIANMMTTMFGSVDNVNLLTDSLVQNECIFKLHIDGAYGGFYYPFSNEDSDMTFENEHITSFTLDAHKMAQAPYGTGIFIIKKNFIHFANTQQASYVEGEDYTLIGSRSGANAIASWMILVTYGPYGWYEKIYILQKRAEWITQQLDELGIVFYRNENSNIVTIKSEYIEKQIAQKHGLVPDNHHSPNWYKIVIMGHVTIEKLASLAEDLRKSQI